MDAKIDVAIIGAGVIGLAAAYELSKISGPTIAVFEKNRSYGQETSSRNSEVIHSGLYYPAKMLKTILCLEGNNLLYDFCRQHQVPHRRLGKLIVAASNEEALAMEGLYQNARSNGVEIDYLAARQINNLEPALKVKEALFVPGTGIIGAHDYMQQLYYLGKYQGVNYLFDSEIIRIEHDHKGYLLETKRETVMAERVINAAGLKSDYIAGLLGIDPIQNDYRLYPCKGEYYRLRKTVPVNHLVYPLPGRGVLGIHITPDLMGNLRLGPNAYYVDDLDYSLDDSHQEEFYQSVKRFLPALEREDISPDFAGIRPKIQGPGDSVKDFIICEESRKGYPGFINMIGIESPGLTSSLAIAAYVRKLYTSNQ